MTIWVLLMFHWFNIPLRILSSLCCYIILMTPSYLVINPDTLVSFLFCCSQLIEQKCLSVPRRMTLNFCSIEFQSISIIPVHPTEPSDAGCFQVVTFLTVASLFSLIPRHVQSQLSFQMCAHPIRFSLSYVCSTAALGAMCFLPHPFFFVYSLCVIVLQHHFVLLLTLPPGCCTTSNVALWVPLKQGPGSSSKSWQTFSAMAGDISQDWKCCESRSQPLQGLCRVLGPIQRSRNCCWGGDGRWGRTCGSSSPTGGEPVKDDEPRLVLTKIFAFCSGEN